MIIKIIFTTKDYAIISQKEIISDYLPRIGETISYKLSLSDANKFFIYDIEHLLNDKLSAVVYAKEWFSDEAISRYTELCGKGWLPH